MRIQIRDPKTLIVHPATVSGMEKFGIGKIVKSIRYKILYTVLRIVQYGMRKERNIFKSQNLSISV